MKMLQVFLVFTLLLTSCRSGLGTNVTAVTENTSTPAESTSFETPTQALSDVSPTPTVRGFYRWTVQQVLEAFQTAGLEADPVRLNDPRDLYGAHVGSGEYARFYVPSWGGDAGGLVFAFETEADLKATYQFYKDLGWYDSGLYYPWVATKDNILLQINGILSEEAAKRYLSVLAALR